jgi:LmbE family N-acetylglucosaminyl deacetylase
MAVRPPSLGSRLAAVRGRRPAGSPASKNGAAPKPAKKRELSVDEKWSTYNRALVITAHPDDAEFIAGGTIAKLAAAGMDVTLCVATSGDKGTRDAELRPQELAAMREQETRAAAKVLGVRRCVFLGYGDGFLEEGPELRGHFVKLIRTLQPDVVLTWDGFRAGFNHTDHRVVGRCVRDALYPAAHDPHYYAELTRAGIGPWRTAELLMASAEDADFHVDIALYLEQKVDAILCHVSQIQGNRDEMLKGWRERAMKNRDRRKQTGFIHAESFKRIEFRRPEGAPGSPPAGSMRPVKSVTGAPRKQVAGRALARVARR